MVDQLRTPLLRTYLPAVWPAVMIGLLVVRLRKWNGIEEERTEHCRRQVRVGGGGAMKGNRPAQPPHSPLDNDNLRHFYTW